jgi:hypothetical protein
MRGPKFSVHHAPAAKRWHEKNGILKKCASKWAESRFWFLP